MDAKCFDGILQTIWQSHCFHCCLSSDEKLRMRMRCEYWLYWGFKKKIVGRTKISWKASFLLFRYCFQMTFSFIIKMLVFHGMSPASLLLAMFATYFKIPLSKDSEIVCVFFRLSLIQGAVCCLNQGSDHLRRSQALRTQSHTGEWPLQMFLLALFQSTSVLT